ncbi:MAG TPA: ABC transporter permease [Gemmatimonadaceae bacterium]|nr:ABC transporter permease [Gemmatimonadaceae bacterium]
MAIHDLASKLPPGIRRVFRRPATRGRLLNDMDEEMRLHLEMRIAELRAAGMSEPDARAEALRRFGDSDAFRAYAMRRATREARRRGTVEWLGDWVRDARFAVRQLRKNVGVTVVAILTLALGIGANTVLFSVVNGVLLDPLPYPNASRLVAIYEVAPGFNRASMSYPNFLDWQQMSRSFSSMAIYRSQDYNFRGPGPGGAGAAERLSGMMVSADFFRTLGQTPILGRDFGAGDDRPGAAPVVILGGGVWRRRFGSSPSVVGRTISLNGTPYTVIGVILPGFTFYGPQRDVYTPIGQWTDVNFRDRSAEVSTHAVGRLATGATLASARLDMDVVARNLAAAFPVADKNIGIALVPLKWDLVGDVQPFLLVLLGAAGCLLLIACVNVANLLLARALGRSREFAIRVALGAGRARLVRQLLTESLLLAAAGSTLALLLALMSTRAVRHVLPSTFPRAGDIALDGHVLLFTLAACVFAALLFGLAPALRGAGTHVQDILKESGRGSSGARHRLQQIFVAVEVALALVLLVGAGLMLRSLVALWHVDPGFTPGHAITFDISLPATSHTTSAETRARLRRLDAAMRATPGVDAVSVTLGSRPMLHDTALPFWIEGRAKPATLHDMPLTMCYLVEGGFREAMGITVKHGRFVRDQDDEHAPVVIDIDDAFARRYFPNENPIGKRINIAGFDVQAEIVGVVGHVKQWGLDTDPTSAVEAQIYYPFMQLPEKLMPLAAGGVAVVVRTRGGPDLVMTALRRAIAGVEPGDVIYGVQSLDAILANSLAPRRLTMTLLTAFAALALLLACVGLYGVISYLVSQRTHEIGIRMALGAQRAEVIRLVLGQGLRMALLGAAVGIVAALGLARLMAAELFGVTAHDPLTFAGVAVILLVVAVVACYVPARRATRVDAVVALRAE